MPNELTAQQATLVAVLRVELQRIVHFRAGLNGARARVDLRADPGQRAVDRQRSAFAIEEHGGADRQLGGVFFANAEVDPHPPHVGHHVLRLPGVDRFAANHLAVGDDALERRSQRNQVGRVGSRRQRRRQAQQVQPVRQFVGRQIGDVFQPQREAEIHQSLKGIESLGARHLARRHRFAQLAPGHQALNAFQPLDELRFRVVDDRRLEQHGLGVANVRRVDDHQHVARHHGVAQALLDAPARNPARGSITARAESRRSPPRRWPRPRRRSSARRPRRSRCRIPWRPRPS